MHNNSPQLPPKEVRLAEKRKKYERELLAYYRTLEKTHASACETQGNARGKLKKRAKLQ